MLRYLLLSSFLFAVANLFGSEKEIELLKKPNHFAMIRHALAPGTGDPPDFKLSDCSTQRNLSDIGVQQAKQLGAYLANFLSEDYYLFTSQWCRCKDTALNFNGPTPKDLSLLNSFFSARQRGEAQTDQLKKWLKENISASHPLILITHQVNITALSGVFPAEGEIIILSLDNDKVEVMARIGPDFEKILDRGR